MNDLRSPSVAIEIKLMVPAYLASAPYIGLAKYADIPFEQFENPMEMSAFMPSSQMSEEERTALEGGGPEADRCCELLAIAEQVKADGLVTSQDLLIQARYSLYQFHRIRIIPLEEFADVVEVCAHGHGLYWSAKLPNQELSVDTCYLWTNPKNRRLCEWWNNQGNISNKQLGELLRGAFFNRYPFILYARDMVRFFELQRDFQWRRESQFRFAIPLGYHVNTLYFFLWGMLEQLTLIAKYKMNLKIDDEKCGIKSQLFWNQIRPHAENLEQFVNSNPIKDWINLMADMRHLAAHGGIPMPTYYVEDTEESTKSDEEILVLVKEEYADFYMDLPPELMQQLEPSLINQWRLQNMQIISEGVVFIERKGRRYMRNTVVSIDYDIERLNAVLDAFLVTLFRKSIPPSNLDAAHYSSPKY